MKVEWIDFKQFLAHLGRLLPYIFPLEIVKGVIGLYIQQCGLSSKVNTVVNFFLGILFTIEE